MQSLRQQIRCCTSQLTICLVFIELQLIVDHR